MNVLKALSRKLATDKTLYLILCGVVLLSLVFALPCRAMSWPTSTPTVIQFDVYRNLLETGDRLLLIYENTPYSTTPTTPASDTFIWRLYAADNVTEIGSAVCYPYHDNGYGYNLVSMYFTAAQATALGFTWGATLNVRLSGNPVYFSPTIPQYNFSITSGDYSSLTVTADVQAELSVRILTLASDLDIQWGLTTYSLLQETETGTVLSLYGEAFFRGAIYGLQGLCPQVFAYVISNIDTTPRTWTTTYVTAVQNQWTGTWVDTAKNALDALFGTSYSIAWLMISIVAMVVVIILDVVVAGDPWLGVLDGCVVLILTTRLGFMNLGILGLIAAVCFMYSSARLWGVFK